MDKTKGITISKIKKKLNDLETKAAIIVNKYDVLAQKFDRVLLIAAYKINNKLYKHKDKLLEFQKDFLIKFTGVLLFTLAIVALFSYTTGYSYSYNGKKLGYVQNQEDVIKILDLVSDELSREYGSSVEISSEENITFKREFTLDKDIDNVDTVLKRFTNMTNMEVKGYGIYIDDALYATCETKKAAIEVLDSIKKTYIDLGNEEDYSKIEFRENVEIKPTDEKLINIKSIDMAYDRLMQEQVVDQSYKVKKGDTWESIAARFGVPVEELQGINKQEAEEGLKKGKNISVRYNAPPITVYTEQTSTFKETIKCKVKEEETNDLYMGDTSVYQEGSDGRRIVTAKLKKENGRIISRKDKHVEILEEPVDRIILIGTSPVPIKKPTGTFQTPVYGYTLTSGFGWRWGRLHSGVDLAAPVGRALMAADGGTVIRAGWYGGYGLCIDIDHGGGVTTRYGHCNAAYVSVGEAVYKGQVIGEVGNTGFSTGPHCHFEIRMGGTPVDPMDYI